MTTRVAHATAGRSVSASPPWQALMSLLAEQLTYRDPVAPMDARQFAAHVAKFRSLAQSRHLKANLQALSSTETSRSSIGLIGRRAGIAPLRGPAGDSVSRVDLSAEYREYVRWATIEVIEALGHCDPNRGAKFRDHAYARLLGAIRDGLEHVSERTAQIGLHRLARAQRAGATRRRRDPVDPAAQSAAEPTSDLADISAGLLLSFMLDDAAAPSRAGAARPLDRGGESPAFAREQQRLRELIARLTPREQAVVGLHYLQGLAYDEIALALRIQKHRISQLHEQALVKLIRALGD